MRCISSYEIYSTEEALSNISKRTAVVVKSIGWREICLSENLSVIREQFIKIYETIEKRERKSMLLTEDVKKEIQGLGEVARRLYLEKEER